MSLLNLNPPNVTIFYNLHFHKYPSTPKPTAARECNVVTLLLIVILLTKNTEFRLPV